MNSDLLEVVKAQLSRCGPEHLTSLTGYSSTAVLLLCGLSFAVGAFVALRLYIVVAGPLLHPYTQPTAATIAIQDTTEIRPTPPLAAEGCDQAAAPATPSSLRR